MAMQRPCQRVCEIASTPQETPWMGRPRPRGHLFFFFSTGRSPADDPTYHPLRPELAGLSISNPGPPLDFAGEPPPPPVISSEGIIARDITDQFFAAAGSKSVWSSPPTLHRADAVLPPSQPWPPASWSRMTTSPCSSPSGLLRCARPPPSGKDPFPPALSAERAG